MMRIDRRGVLAGGLVGFGAASGRLSATIRPNSARIEQMRVCGLDAPPALGDRRPRFSWRIVGLRPGDEQIQYRIRVATSAAALATGADLWDSGRRPSAACFDIAYEGTALEARARAFWQVDVWTRDGQALAGNPAPFGVGLIGADDWSAAWIAAETEEARLDRAAGLHWLACDAGQAKGQICGFRTTITRPDDGTGELLLSAVELEGAWLNGRRLMPAQDEPVAWTTMALFPLALKRGPNVLAVAVRRAVIWGVPEPVMAAIVRLGGGLGARLTTASGWRSSLVLPEGWEQSSFDDQAWKPASLAKRPPNAEPWPAYPAMLLRRPFEPRGPIREAQLHATALGMFEPWLNGQPISDAVMAPSATDPASHILYRTYDVTAAIRPGANMLGLWLGDGWYGSEFSTWARFPFGPAPCRIRAQLEVSYLDGTSETIGTDEHWVQRASPIRASEIYDGEVYDARAETSGWTDPASSTAGWAPVEAAQAPDVPIDPERCLPARVVRTVRPVNIRKVRAGVHVFDFGQNFAGWAKLRVEAAAGTRIEMRFAEICKPTGEVDQSNLRSAFARDIYIARGGGPEVWEPRFTYHGFRYVEVHGLPGAPTPETLTGCVVHLDLPETGALRIGDPVVQQFWRNSVWSQRSNFVGLPTDCPQRDERLGWMGDAEVFWPAAAYNMDLQAYTARVMLDVRRAQASDGRLPDVIPPLLRNRMTTSPGWADAGVILPHTAWRHYGDTGIIAENWDAMDRYMAWILRHNSDHVWRTARGEDFGDWLAVDAKEPGDPTTPKDLIATAYWASNASRMAEMAAAVGRREEAIRYQHLFDDIRAAFNAAFVSPDGRVGNDSQTSYVLPIRFGLLSVTAKEAAGRRLAMDIARRGGTLSTGFLGTPHILDALADSGQERAAISLLLQRKWPSWGYMVDQGATTMWERWNSDRGDVAMNSFNHYAFGAIGSFLYRRVAGVEAAEPGFRKVRIAPIFDARIGHAGADCETVLGPIRVDWRMTGRRALLEIALPSGATGALKLPAGATIRRASGASALGPGRHVLTIDLGPDRDAARGDPRNDIATGLNSKGVS